MNAEVAGDGRVGREGAITVGSDVENGANIEVAHAPISCQGARHDVEGAGLVLAILHGAPDGPSRYRIAAA
jgi:hypothetical protein